ncbi:hypothetical protein B0H16DRAFT_1477055 [Mycena metata]|uniref:Uncharacterized protein n=1 Tax=Mycena metata TaxID=1033252 RepID=A0AAD7HAL0_9AGAR|nr:hypothetical protein B0H16DRAFT_1477055 [Mycena metata]
MDENPCREMVVYQPLYRPAEEWDDLPELIPDEDWCKHMVNNISVLAYHASFPYVACDGSFVMKPRGYASRCRDHGIGERAERYFSSAFASSADLQKGEAYVDVDYQLSQALAAAHEILANCLAHARAMRFSGVNEPNRSSIIRRVAIPRAGMESEGTLRPHVAWRVCENPRSCGVNKIGSNTTFREKHNDRMF